MKGIRQSYPIFDFQSFPKMPYDLTRLDPHNFEHLIQSLSRKILGYGTVSFGRGPDGGREASFKGKAPFPSTSTCWDGYWVIQAKYRSIATAEEGKDFSWVKTNLQAELEKYATRKTKVETPDNYLFFTNIILTATPKTGGQDKAIQLEKVYSKKYGIKNIKILGHNDICDFLDNNRDLAIAYAPFVLPGDILTRLLDFLDVKISHRRARIAEVVNRFLEVEFKENEQAKLDHAGKLTSDKINLDKVFIDLYATENGMVEESNRRFIESIMTVGNSILRQQNTAVNRYVLVAGPGYGKSTLTQFLAQIYRGYFLLNNSGPSFPPDAVHLFLRSLGPTIPKPKWSRLPIRITLKEYAGWIIEKIAKDKNSNISILAYIQYLINKKSGSGDISLEEIEHLIKTLPCLFLFDGLDEVPSSSNRKEVLSEIYTFTDTILRQLEADYIIVSTTRPQGYAKEFDSSKYAHLYITDLQKRDCQRYLQKLLLNLIDDSTDRKNKLEILYKALENNETGRLMLSPLQASIMAILVKSGGEPARNKFDLFTDYYDIIFRREKQRNIYKVLSENPEYVKQIHFKLGLYLQTVSEKTTNPSSLIDISLFKDFIRDYLASLELESEDIIRVANEILEAVTNRLVFINESEDQKIGFTVRSLQEYFAANGYIHNIEDSRIEEQIKGISENAYWSNTLLFTIGYISKYKNYFTSNIESICHELNGSSDDSNEKSLTSLPKSGSWLALDILNEGIFRSIPKLENKFCNLLHPLFYIAPISKHKELAKLPSRVVEKFIMRDLEECLQRGNKNQAAWTICIHLSDAGINITPILDKYLPFDLGVLGIFTRHGVYHPSIIEKYIYFIDHAHKSELLTLFKTYPDLFAAISSSKINDEIKIILLELLFIITINFVSTNSLRHFINVFNHLNLKINNASAYFSEEIEYYPLDANMIDIVPGYKYSIREMESMPDEVFSKMYHEAQEKNIQLIIFTLNFFENQEYSFFTRLMDHLNSQKPDFKQDVISVLMNESSFMQAIFSEIAPVTEQQFLIIESEIEMAIIGEQFNVAEIFAFQKYSLGRSLSVVGPLARLHQYQKLYWPEPNEELKAKILSEYFYLFNWSFKYLETEEIEQFKSVESSMQLLADSFKETLKDEIHPTNFISAIYVLDLHHLSAIYDNIPVYSRFTIKYRSLPDSYDIARVSKALANCCDLIKYQIISKRKPCYKTWIQLVIFVTEFFQSPLLYDAPVPEILNYRSDSEEEKFKAVLLIMDSSFGLSHHAEIVRIIKHYKIESADAEFLRGLLFALKYCPINADMEKTILFLSELFTGSQPDLNSEFLELVKQYIGKKPTGLQAGF
jgi:hypothetical protein